MGRIKEAIRKWKLGRKAPGEVFSAYYHKNKWGDEDSRSGKGSNLTATEVLRQRLPELVAELDAKSFLDLPCGDYFWMQHVDLGVQHYTGGDIVAELIADNRVKHAREGVNFEVIDLIQGPVPKHDLVFVRDCLVHLSTEHVKAALANIKASGSEWLLTTTYPGTGTNDEISTGQWRSIDLQAAPFNLPAPAKLLEEGQEDVPGQLPNKMLGLWRVADLPGVEGQAA
ncbi:class I SAM-dependent methyltransferase [Alisedimentitalea sp. MJ-SS2]|uniref:class I SAM-dependent methyltransferase n=1 Tax=Aliisedimentitalea sp. MJ-SS2 TaxID=3049795 RepID=UPI0029079331|nr:class I SAM-dependent methyltransferase [Alisedimentitalea sp. MJ-SS2]MDU8929291.1 class I SAM-dependent methyltransferase [Alisedimentitalea sp. MJ-SS2]